MMDDLALPGSVYTDCVIGPLYNLCMVSFNSRLALGTRLATSGWSFNTLYFVFSLPKQYWFLQAQRRSGKLRSLGEF
jgi:hypothetical protein